jgi:3-deoxy-manno-octulosonate cytidylyltransferase (CMP-KDO synthetase)
MSGIAGVIPARWGSTRFPGKILAPIAGKPLVQWVWERASQATRLDTLLVATDDPRIAEAVAAFGGQAVMTRADHPSGTDRIAEAIAGLDVEAAVNIQGDEPLIDPALIDAVAACVADADAGWDMATAAEPLTDPERIAAPAVVKVVCDAEGRALYFSRSVIPHCREGGLEEAEPPLYLRHVGIYAYRRTCLEQLVRTPPTRLEMAEKLEQLRALHLGARIRVMITQAPALGVDEPADVARAEAALRQAGLVEA